MKNLILVDIETTGTDRLHSSILSIGAVDYNSEKEFYIECRADEDSNLENGAMAINGFSYTQVYDQSKPTSLEAYQKFEKWAFNIYENPILGGENVGQFDAMFLCKASGNMFSLNWPFKHRFFDLHSIVYFLTGESLSLKDTAKKYGLEPEPAIHNALNGAKKAKEILTYINDNYFVILEYKPSEEERRNWILG